jgi:hypothetical protein
MTSSGLDGKKAVCMAVHRTLLLNPLLGLQNRLGKHCTKVMSIPWEDDMLENESSSLFTWKPSDSIFVTLLKHSPNSTAVFLHDSDMHYQASAACSLGPACPTGTVLLGQVLLDHSPEDLSYRIMVLLFDALQIGDQDFVALRMMPQERYARMRQLCDNSQGVILSPTTMMVQWAGKYDLVKEFSMGFHSEQNLPNHVAEGIIAYGQDHPCKLCILDRRPG